MEREKESCHTVFADVVSGSLLNSNGYFSKWDLTANQATAKPVPTSPPNTM